jgi:AcrR family transcriptional regulator
MTLVSKPHVTVAKKRTAAGLPAARAARRVGNRERIIEASLALFNAHGAHAVSTNHIAAHLAISPGNLYYHFANREEIIRALFPQAARAVYGTLPVARDREVSAADVGRYHLAGIETLWRFRFFFRDVDELLSRDPVLADWFRELQRWLVGQFEILFERLIVQGQMRRPEPRDDLPRLAVNAFILWTNWIRYLTSSRATLDVRHADIVGGALHGFLSFAPYLEPRFAEEVRATFDARARKQRRVASEPPSDRARPRRARVRVRGAAPS